MQMHTRLKAIVTALLAVTLALALSDAAWAKRKKLKTPSTETGIKRDLDGAPNIKVDNRAKRLGRPSRKRPASP